MTANPEKMEEVLAYFDEQDPERQEVMRAIHAFLMSYPGMKVRLRYGIPFYDIRTWICYLNAAKTGGTELAFVRANELENVGGLLDFRGRTQVAGVVWHQVREIRFEALAEIMEEALKLDEEKKYTVRKK